MNNPAPTPSPSSSAGPVLSALPVVLAGTSTVLFFYYLQATAIRLPFWDMFSHITRYLQYRANGNWWAYLWEPHAQHRHVWMRLLTALDVEAFAGVVYPFIVTSTACLLLTAWLLCRETPRPLRWLVVMLVLTAVNAVDCAIPMHAVYPQTLVFAVLAFVLFAGAGDAGRHGRSVAHLARLAAVLAAVGATFGNSAGLATWPILGWLAWRGRAGRGWAAALALAGVAFVSFYLYRLPLLSGGEISGAADAGGLARAGTYFLTYLGLPWTRAAGLELPGRLVGAILCGLGAWGVFRHGAVSGPDGRRERIAVALVLFSLATAALAAVGRSVDGDMRVPVRYSVFLVPLHVGLVWLWWPRVERLLTHSGPPTLLPAAMTAIAVALTIQQVVAGEAAAATTRAMRATIARFAAGTDSPEMTRVVFDDLGQARRDWNAIRAAGLYLRAQ